ncbi:MAG: SAM-dependent methyltransferase, partial [Candidatus Marinimicrobia bacterium]|nr:SAM-dependent methyltransferase [Candidatus Neomarinimicrobiota bacterium]
MLDQDTKRKIDNARDILVGKIPDPKSQVEQITISLIYKFMDDMDLESIEMGGVASFFTGDYQKYAWSKIFDRSLSGFELINLYGEAIIKMNQNPNIPQLFRDIFKNAYLPYRDPETLRAFLKEINGFHYDHSERLGDAFEYLLSVLSSQGDAGQFRTPRHIIDFIVQVVNPQKNQTILDPACGTAGFLISSYKNILAENTRDKRGDLLTPAECLRLMRNSAGYDISPDMVRLSLVNLYLHGFPDPIIHEYDTLTSEERWNETYDVILANPPFMTPKGGIRPHKRFSVQAKRSEVLFVDYIAEHLNPGGRAGVIVPEGIIFQSQNAYKKLRKMLVENFLYAVVSLPAGVFQPYSGVKTSILLMDKSLSKRTDKILFVKIENDGYDLGAQRRPIDKNDLPKALEFLQDYRKALLNNETLENTDYAHIVDKSKIEESGDWNLSGERYKKNKMKTSHFKIINLRGVAKIGSGNSAPQDNKYFINGKYP